MTNICLECATPKFMKRAERGLTRCHSCQRDTHTIEGTPRRPLCHDCDKFKVHCVDGTYRSALSYGREYLAQAHCRVEADESSLVEMALTPVARAAMPQMAKYDPNCPAFKRHRNAPTDGRPNPMSIQEREEWRTFLEMPTAFWLNPRRWDHVKDERRQKFWMAKEKNRKGGSGAAILGGVVAIAAGILVSKKS